MNYDYLPQPPEGILDPDIPWSRLRPTSRLWVTLKARLTGRPTEGEHYSSYVNISEADADRLIENLKKDPRGYPSLDQSSGTPVQWMERQQKYQQWLVEEYLENPFREDVNKKIEEAEQQRRLQEIQEQRRKDKEEQEAREKRKKEREQIKPAEAPAPAPVTPAAPPPPDPAPPPPEPPRPKPAPLRDEDLVAPNQMPSNVSRAMAKYGDALDAIGNQLSKQNTILTRSLGELRRIDEDLDDVEFLLDQMSENYREALDDFETEERKKEARRKFVAKLTSPFQKKQEPTKISSTQKKPKEDKPWWNFWDTNNKSQKKLASGGVSVTGTGGGKIIPPGIYDNPVQGKLAPGTAVVPLNRNYGKEILGQYDTQKNQQSLGEVLAKSTNALLGSAVAVYGYILRGLGPLAGYFNTGIPSTIPGISSILGISRSAVIDMLGGPAYAGVAPNERELNYFYKSWRVYMDKHGLYFPGGFGPFGGDGEPKQPAEFAKDILTIGSGGEGLSMMGGTNVSKPPAWIPFPKDAAGKLEYSSGYGWRWGRRHTGIDLAGDPGIKIISPFAGKVSDVDNDTNGSGYGKYVEIEHQSPKIFTFYGHLKDISDTISMKANVSAGQVIGTLGNTGRSTGPHLHWEIRKSHGGDQVDPVEWTHQNKPSLQSGGWFKPLVNLVSRFTTPKGLSIRGVQAGFTGMAREGFQAIMSGAKFKNPTKASLIGKGSSPVLGHGAYSAPTAQGASRYVKPGGGIVKSIVPANARGINFIEPQSVVPPATFDKGKLLADKLLRGEYANSILANKLRAQLLSGTAQNVGIGLGKIFAKASGILNAPLVGDMLFPEATAPGTLDYARSQGWITPQQSKPAIKSTTIQMPSSPKPATRQTSSTPQFVDIDIPTNTVLITTQMRRM